MTLLEIYDEYTCINPINRCQAQARVRLFVQSFTSTRTTVFAPTLQPRAAVDSRCRRACSAPLEIFFSKRRPFLTVSTHANLSRDIRARDLRMQRDTRRRGSAESRKFARSVYLYSWSPCVIFSFYTEKRDLRPSRAVFSRERRNKHPA